MRDNAEYMIAAVAEIDEDYIVEAEKCGEVIKQYKIRRKRFVYKLLAAVGGVAVFIIFFMIVKITRNESVKAADLTNFSYVDYITTNCVDGLFDDDTYIYSIGESKLITKIYRKDGINTKSLYTSEDMIKIIKMILDVKYELRETAHVNNYYGYEEYNGDIPTGAFAGVVYDEKGYMSSVVFRHSKNRDVDVTALYEVNSLIERTPGDVLNKYNDKKITDFEYDSNDIYYNPDVGLCYRIYYYANVNDVSYDKPLQMLFYGIYDAFSGELIAIASSM